MAALPVFQSTEDTMVWEDWDPCDMADQLEPIRVRCDSPPPLIASPLLHGDDFTEEFVAIMLRSSDTTTIEVSEYAIETVPSVHPPLTRQRTRTQSHDNSSSLQQQPQYHDKRTPPGKPYVTYTDADVLCQRGALGNKHPGNQRYLRAKESLQDEYHRTADCHKKFVSLRLVQLVQGWGGRFLQFDGIGWLEATAQKAREKASQALRERLTPEDRAAKRAKYPKKKKRKRR